MQINILWFFNAIDLNEGDRVIVHSGVFDGQVRYLKSNQLDKIFYFFPLAGEATMFLHPVIPSLS